MGLILSNLKRVSPTSVSVKYRDDNGGPTEAKIAILENGVMKCEETITAEMVFKTFTCNNVSGPTKMYTAKISDGNTSKTISTPL